jgi:hypothetical protein
MKPFCDALPLPAIIPESGHSKADIVQYDGNVR